MKSHKWLALFVPIVLVVTACSSTPAQRLGGGPRPAQERPPQERPPQERPPRT